MAGRAGYFAVAVFAVGFIAASTIASAEILPGRPITIVVPFPPGASTDTLMRKVTKVMTDNTGQVFVIENRPGAGGAVGTAAVKQAIPDGHTLLQANVGTHSVSPAISSKLNYDPQKDFEPITLMWNFPSVLTVPASSPAKTVKDLVAYAKTKPSGLNFGSPGVGSGGHVLGEMLKTEAGISMVHVPFRGAAPAVQDLVAGRIDLMFTSYASVAPFVQSGQLRALAVSGRKRLEALPKLPTMAEAGFPEVDFDAWFGLMAPAGTPKSALKKLHDATVAAIESPEVIKFMKDLGVEAVTSNQAAFAALITSDRRRMDKLVQAAGMKRQ